MPNYSVATYEETPVLRFDGGQFEGLLFTFGPITFIGEDAEGNGHVTFDYSLMESPREIGPSELDELERQLGEILADIMLTMNLTGDNTPG